MTPRACALLLSLVLLMGCGGSSRVVRLDTGRGPLTVYTSRTDVAPVELERGEFEAALRKMGRSAAVSEASRGSARRLFNLRDGRAYSHVRRSLGLVSVEDPQRGRLLAPDAPAASTELASAYGRWCQRKHLSGDCLHLLAGGFSLDEDGKRTLAFRIALDAVWDETAEALKDMTVREAVIEMLATTGAIYLGMWLLPEPISKGLAATLTVALIAYLGIDTVWGLIQGWRVLADEVATATTFDEVRTAGEAYGKVMGRNTARVFVMLAMAALGSTTETLSAKIPSLPGSAQASLVGAGQGGFRLAAAGQVTSVAMASGGVITIALDPDALASTARGPVAATEPVEAEGHEHHIATNKFGKATHSGGPWTPKLQDIFDRAGMSLDDAANRVRVPGHKGPHPREYHEEVYRRLNDATLECTSMQQCRAVLIDELRALAEEILEAGSTLNKLVTRS